MGPRRLRTFVRGASRRYITILGLLVLAIGLAFTLSSSTPQPPAETPDVITYSTDNPSESKPNPDTFSWKGEGAMPKYINLPTIKAEGFIQRVGVDQHKAVAVPNNIHMAGWYTASQLPGTSGLSIIDGHLDGRTSAGIFNKLAKLEANDTFTITLGNNAIREFVVRRVQSLAAKDAASLLFSQDPAIGKQLNLITCGGNFDRGSRTYEKRILVIAESVAK